MAAASAEEPTALVWRSGAIGDFVLTLPALAALRRYAAPAPLRLFARPALAPFAQPEQAVDIDGAELAALFAAGAPLPASLGGNIAWVLAYSIDRQGVLAQNLRRLLPRAEIVVWDPRPLAGATRHITDHLLAPLARWGQEGADPQPRIVLAPAALAWAEQFCRQQQLAAPLVALHPGSGGRAKCWPLARFVGLAAALRRRGYGVVAALGPVEVEWAAALRQDAACQVVVPPDLPALAALLQRFSATVAP